MSNPDSPFSGNDAPGGVIGALSVDDSDMKKVLGQFLMRVTGVAMPNIVVGQANRVPMPAGSDFIIMTPSSRASLATTTHAYRPDDAENDIGQSTRFGMQLDFYGKSAYNNVQRAVTLFRDQYGATFMAGSGFQPLYCDDASQTPLVTGEQQYLDRWTMMAYIQATPTISTPTEFADSVAVTLVEADQ